MNTTSFSVKAAMLLMLACFVAACTPTDAYRGNTPRYSSTLPERQNAERTEAISIACGASGGLVGSLLGVGLAKLTEPKDPGTTPIAPTAGKTEYLEPVAAAPKKEPVRTSAKSEKTKSDSNGTVYYSE